MWQQLPVAQHMVPMMMKCCGSALPGCTQQQLAPGFNPKQYSLLPRNLPTLYPSLVFTVHTAA